MDPNRKIIIAGDANQLKYKDLLVHASLPQMVIQPTRGNNISVLMEDPRHTKPCVLTSLLPVYGLYTRGVPGVH